MASQKSPSLVLETLELLRNENNAFGFAATGTIIKADGTTPPNFPAMRLGIGQAANVPAAIAEAFATDGLKVDCADLIMWLGTVDDGSEVDEKSAWFVSFTSGGIDLYGLHSMEDQAIQFAGTQLTELSLKVALKIRGFVVEAAVLSIIGKIKSDSDPDNTNPVARLTGTFPEVTFSLDLNVDDPEALDTILAKPESLLNGAFTGELKFSVSEQPFTISDSFKLEQTDIEFFLQVSSIPNVRELNLDEVTFSLKSPVIELGVVGIENLDVSGGFDGDKLFLRGAAEFTLPDLFNKIIDDTSISGSFDLSHGEETRIELGMNRFTLDPKINFLGLSARNWKLILVKPMNGDWDLWCNGVMYQSWSAVASRLDEARVLRLPGGANFPDLRGECTINPIGDGSRGNFIYKLDFLRPGTGSQEGVTEQPFAGTLGPLPIIVSDASLELSLGFTEDSQDTKWEVGGECNISTTGWLREPLPITDLEVKISATGIDNELPELLITISDTNSIPVLTLPAFLPDGKPVRIFQPEYLSLRIGKSLEIEGAVNLIEDLDLVRDLGMPDKWKHILEPVGATLLNATTTLNIKVPLSDSRESAKLEIKLSPNEPNTFALLEAIGEMISTAAPSDENPAPRDFFAVTPKCIRFAGAFGGGEEPSLNMSFEFDCEVFKEGFDATASLGVVGGVPEFSLMAGTSDPIRLVIPSLNPEDMLGIVDIDAIESDYNLNLDQQEELNNVWQGLLDLFDSPGAKSSLIFEVRDFGIRVRLEEAPSVSGNLRLVQFPSLPAFLNDILPEDGFGLVLGSSLEDIFVEIKMAMPPETAEPLKLPVGTNDEFVLFYLNSFKLAYSWGKNAFEFGINAKIDTKPSDLFEFECDWGGGYIPVQKCDLRIGKTVAPDPVVIPEWDISFRRDGSDEEPIDNAADDMGLQLYFGPKNNRLLTLYFRETIFSPTYFLLSPGLLVDGGVIFGGQNPKNYATFDEFIETFGSADEENFFAHFSVEQGLLQLINPMIGLMVNPMAAIPPFLSPLPPYWFALPVYMGDIFAEKISMSVNIPYLLYFSVDIKKPLPNLSLQALLELAAMAMTGFQETIPEDSPLRDVFFASMKADLELPLIEGLTGQAPKLSISDPNDSDKPLEINIADVMDGLIQVSKTIGQGLNNVSETVKSLDKDPSFLVRMIPVEYRRFESNCEVLGFSFSGSLYLLTPEEFRKELVLFHENRRPMKKLPGASRGSNALTGGSSTKPIINTNTRMAITGNPLKYSDSKDPTFHKYTIDKTGDALDGYQGLDDSKQESEQKLHDLVETVWMQLKYTRLHEASMRKQILAAYKLEDSAPKIEELIRKYLTYANIPAYYFVHIDPTPSFPYSLPLHTCLSLRLFTFLRDANLLKEDFVKYLEAPASLTADHTEKIVIVSNSDLLKYFSPKDRVFQKCISNKANDAVLKGYEGLDKLKKKRKDELHKLVETVWEQIEATKLSEALKRKQILETYKLDDSASELEYLIRKYFSYAHISQPLSTFLRDADLLQEDFVRYLEDRDDFATIKGLDKSPVQMAENIVIDLVEDVHPVPLFGFIIPPPSVVGIVDSHGTRIDIYRDNIPYRIYDDDLTADLLENSLEPFITDVKEGNIFTEDKADDLRDNLKACITEKILSGKGVVYDKLRGEDLLEAARIDVMKAIETLVTTPIDRKYGVFNGELTRKLLSGTSGGEPSQEDQKVSEVVGYEIRSREGFNSDGEEPFRSDQIKSPSTPFIVRTRGGHYRLLTLDEKCLFSWDDVIGNDRERFIEFLKQKSGIDWVETAEIEKIDDGKTIRVSAGNNYLSLGLNDEKTKVNLEIDDGRTEGFIAKTVNGKSNIYYENGEKLDSHILDDYECLMKDLHESPDKADKIRERLVIAERIEDRDRTPEEAEVAEKEDTRDNLYQESILARDEYKLKNEGGIHGPLYLGDLLKGSDTGNNYIVPEYPTLLAGLTLDLWGNKIGLSGLVARTDNIFLNGYHDFELKCRIGNNSYILRLKGEFHLIAGSMWGELADGLECGTLSFKGFVEFKHNNSTKFKGSASGMVQFPGPTLKLRTTVELYDSWTLEMGDAEIAKIIFGGDFGFSVEYDGDKFKLDVHLELGVKYGWARFKQEKVVLHEGSWICSPPFPHLKEDCPSWKRECWVSKRECTEIPPIIIEVPDLNKISWPDENNMEGVDILLGILIDSESGDFKISLTEETIPLELEIPDLLGAA